MSRRRGNLVQGIDLAPHLRELMLIELMTTPTLASMVEALFDAAEADPSITDDQTIVVPGDERRAWGLS